MIPILNRSHIFSFCEDPDKVGLVVESAFVTYLGCAYCRVCQQIASLCHSEVVYIGDKGNIGLSFKEMTEC